MWNDKRDQNRNNITTIYNNRKYTDIFKIPVVPLEPVF